MSMPEPASRSATCHYPTHLIDGWQDRRGEQFVLRPILPQDGPLLQAFHASLGPRNRRLRFHGAVNELPPATLARMTDVDHDRHEALVMTCIDGGVEVIVADARYVVDGTGRGGEFAIAVADAWQRRGIATRAIDGLCKAARLRGLGWLWGEILEDNEAMLSLVERSGFCRSTQAREGTIRVERSVAAAPARRQYRERAPLALVARWLSAAGSQSRWQRPRARQ